MSRVRLLAFCFLFVVGRACAGIHFSSKTSTFGVGSSARLGIQNGISNWDGTLERADGGIITGSSIMFNEGIFDDAGTELKLTAAYDPDASQKITLSGNKSFRAASGAVVDKLVVSGTNNRLEGQPLFGNSDSITLSDANSTLIVCRSKAITGSTNCKCLTIRTPVNRKRSPVYPISLSSINKF